MQDDVLSHCSASGGNLNLTIRNYNDALPFCMAGVSRSTLRFRETGGVPYSNQ